MCPHYRKGLGILVDRAEVLNRAVEHFTCHLVLVSSWDTEEHETHDLLSVQFYHILTYILLSL